MKKCPFCAEDIQDDAIKCRFCGEMMNSTAPKTTAKTAALLSRHKANADALETKQKGSPLGFLGACLLIVGLVVVVYFMAYFDTSVAVPQTELFGRTIGGGRVNNLGLMQDKQNALMLGGASAIVGLVLVVWSGDFRK